ncbi:MAG: hypothetical protein Q8P89_00360 [bacterium]|nr:hypothetical protein [bacterium]
MKIKVFLTTICAFISTLLLTGAVWAADVSVRLEDPKTPTNQDTFDLTFVVLDIQNRPSTVKCFKKGPGESSASQFGSDINLAAGGMTSRCHASSSIISAKGSYEFFVTAQAGSETVTSPTVTVDFDNSTPDTPVNYKKEKHSSCQYTILFKTGNDSGKTAKVELYRSDKSEFEVNSTTRVGSLNIGSNQEGSFEDTIPDCAKEYFYVIRAFSSIGNGSGIIGDSVVKVVTSTIETSTTQTVGAIAVSQGGVLSGDVLGEEEKKEGEGEIGKSPEGTAAGGEVKAASEENQVDLSPKETFTRRNIGLGIVAFLILVTVLSLYRRKKPLS